MVIEEYRNLGYIPLARLSNRSQQVKNGSSNIVSGKTMEKGPRKKWRKILVEIRIRHFRH